MLSWFKKYWLEIAVFALLGVGYLLCASPSFTWINTDSDGAHYTYAAKWFYPAHSSSAPLFLIIAHFFTLIPFGTDFWNIALISVISSVIACIFVYAIVKHYTRSRAYSLISAVVFGGSAIAISQGTIVETYALVTMCMVGAYYFALKSRWALTAIFLGAGMAVHPLATIASAIIFFSFKPFRNWRYILISASFAIFYLYIPLTNRPPYMWQSQSNSFSNSLNAMKSTILMLSGQISIWALPKRIIETLLLVIVTLGAGIFPAFIALKKLNWKAHSLFWLMIIPILYFVTDLSPQTYVYILPAMAFGACLVGIGLAKLNKQWATGIVGLVAVILALFNFNYMDIGRTLDPNMESVKYYNELNKVPDGQILVAQQGWEWAMIFVYNKYENRNIIPVCAINLPDKTYRELIRDTYGVKTDYNNTTGTIAERQIYQTEYVFDNNENVWFTQTSDARNYGAIIVKPTNETRHIITPWSPLDSEHPAWQWKPNNPYDIITGAIEVTGWSYVLMSSYSALTFGMLATIGGMPGWVLYQVIVKKRKWSLNNVKGKVSGV